MAYHCICYRSSQRATYGRRLCPSCPFPQVEGLIEVTPYSKLINWLLRAIVDEAALASQVEEFTLAHQKQNEYEMSFSERTRKLNNICGFLRPQAVLNSQFVERLHWLVRMETREHDTSRATLAGLARFAYRRCQAYRMLRSEQR